MTNPRTNPLQGVISDSALKALADIVSPKTMQGQLKEGVTKADVNLRVEQMVAIVAADIDGADGKFDYRIDRRILKEKLEKLSKSDLMGKEFNVTKAMEKLAGNLPAVDGDPNMISSKDLIAKTLRVTEGMVSKSFDNLDKDKNGVITISELPFSSYFQNGVKGGTEAAASKLQAPLPAAPKSKSARIL